MINEQSSIILFDGYCNLCNGFVRFIIRHDKKGLFLYTPLQSEKGIILLEQYGQSNYAGNSIVYIHRKKCYFRSDAALWILKELNYPYKLLYAGKILPRPFRDGLYNLIARYRYRLFGKSKQCMLPDNSIRNRFI